MNREFYQLLTTWPLPVIKDDDITASLTGGEAKRHSLIRRYVNKGWPTRLKRGLYSLVNSPLEVANYLYSPSYISFETSLALYGLIPESIHQISSASYKRNKKYHNSLGTYYYFHVPTKNFFLGVRKKDKLLVAAPLKAICDIYYTQKRKWNCWDDILEDLRIDEPELLYEESLFIQLLENYQSKKVRSFLKQLGKYHAY